MAAFLTKPLALILDQRHPTVANGQATAQPDGLCLSTLAFISWAMLTDFSGVFR